MNTNSTQANKDSNATAATPGTHQAASKPKIARKTWREQWVEFKNHWHIVYEYLREKAIDGVCLGCGVFVFTFIPAFQKLAADLTDLFIHIPFIIAAGGILSMLVYTVVTENISGTLIHRVAQAWFDLVQQFFCIALGAYVPLHLAGLVHDGLHRNTVGQEFLHGLVSLSAYALLALLCGGAWALRNERKSALPSFFQTITIGVIFIAGIAILAAIQFFGVEHGVGQDFVEFLFSHY